MFILTSVSIAVLTLKSLPLVFLTASHVDAVIEEGCALGKAASFQETRLQSIGCWNDLGMIDGYFRLAKCPSFPWIYES